MGFTFDFFGVVGSVSTVFLVCGIAAALGLAAWITFFQGSPGDKLPGFFGRVPKFFDRVPRFFDRLSGSIGKRDMTPVRDERAERRSQRREKKAAGAKRKRPSE